MEKEGERISEEVFSSEVAEAVSVNLSAIRCLSSSSGGLGREQGHQNNNCLLTIPSLQG